MAELQEQIESVLRNSLVTEDASEECDGPTPAGLGSTQLVFLEAVLPVPAAIEPDAALTRTFDYDTSDPRTKKSGFVKKRYEDRRHLPDKYYSLGGDEGAITFARDLRNLSKDISNRQPTWGSAEADELLNRVLRLYKECGTRLHRKYHSRVHQELDSLALRVCGRNVKNTIEMRQARHRIYRGVPAEIRPIFRGGIVSGGLPTMGRGRR